MTEHKTNCRPFWVWNLCNCTGCVAEKGPLVGTVPNQVLWRKMTEEERGRLRETVSKNFFSSITHRKVHESWLHSLVNFHKVNLCNQPLDEEAEHHLHPRGPPFCFSWVPLSRLLVGYFCLFAGFIWMGITWHVFHCVWLFSLYSAFLFLRCSHAAVCDHSCKLFNWR